eukprot:CAMPEP_0114254360 /NCGR_PEP_ID=MMETSP0058-20121206/16936_1 /TAXON_ID=36894 /ORGANISM="Pyramimonas parkeae, CCMP726" /LENGTH=251 /DNA_ID=CAMNT_0001368571 /DNA_START=177 /DNA_END=932 /DNA_ORIENTATION=+
MASSHSSFHLRGPRTCIKVAAVADETATSVSIVPRLANEEFAPPKFELQLRSLRSQGAVVHQVGTRYLALHDYGPDVRELQRFLQMEGSFPKSQDVTGYFGPLTEQAVKEWQMTHNIPSTGGFGLQSRTVYLAQLKHANPYKSEPRRLGGRSTEDTLVTSTGPAVQPVVCAADNSSYTYAFLGMFAKTVAVVALFIAALRLSKAYFQRLRAEEEQRAMLEADRELQVQRYSSMLNKDRKPDSDEVKPSAEL